MNSRAPESPEPTPPPPRRGRGRPPRDPGLAPNDPGVIGGRAAESFSRAILNSLPAHLAVLEHDGRVVAVNKAYERFAHERAEEFPEAPGLGANYLDAVHDGVSFERAARAEALDGLQQVLDRQKARFELEYPIDLPGGRRWFLLTATPLLGADGGAVVSHVETTEQRNAERQIAEQHRVLQAVLESTADGVVVADATGEFTLFNQAAREIAGVGIIHGDPESWSTNYGIFRPDRVTLFRPEEVPLYRAIRGESTDDIRMFLRNSAIPEGRFISISGRPWSTPDGQRHGGVVVFRDITARVLAEEHSRLQVEVLDAVPLAVAALDAEGRVVYWNPAAEHLMGWSAAHLVGRVGREVLLDDAQRAQVDAIRAYIEGGQPFRGEFKVRKPDGSSVTVLASAQARRRPDGTLDGFVLVGVDLTDEHLAQEALRAREYDLRQSQKLEAIGRLAGGVAHDFNNLLTVIRGTVDLLLRRLPAGDAARVEVEQVSRAVDRAAELTGQLLAFSRRDPLQPGMLSLNAVISDVMPMLRRTIGEGIRVRVELDPGLGQTRADAGLIGQVLLNLVLNARDAMPEGGELSIRTDEVDLTTSFPDSPGTPAHGAYVRLSVSDTGAGMDEEVRARVFEPFFTTKEPGKGTGLGLSTAYGIARQLGGHIGIDTAPGRGTTFHLYVPRVFGADVPPPAPAVAPGAVPAATTATILLVEDDAAVRHIERRLLEVEGHLVLEAGDCESALELVRAYAGRIDLVVCDVMLPGRNGWEASAELKRLRPDARTLFVSGHDRGILARLGGNPDAPFLHKPFSTAELHAAVRAALTAPTPPAPRRAADRPEAS